MNLVQSLERLLPECVKAFEGSDIWQDAAAKGLSWQDALLDREAVKEALSRLSRPAKEVLVALQLRFGAEPVEEDRLLSALREHTALSGAEARLGLRQLEDAGIVLVAKKVWGDRICFMPTESFLLWQQILFPCQLTEYSDPVQPLIDDTGRYIGVKEPLGRRLLYMLSALLKSESSFTAKGVLPKKTVQRLQAALELEENLLRTFTWSAAHGEHYPVPVAFAFAAAAGMGLLKRDEQGLSVDPAGLQKWFSQSEKEQEKQILRWAYGYLVRSTGMDAHVGAALTGVPSGKWFSAIEAEEWGARLLGGSGLPAEGKPAVNRVERWLCLLHELGWLELAAKGLALDGSELMFRWREFPAAISRGLIIQPTGEMLVEPGSDHCLRWELELIAERMNREEPVLYRLTASTIAAALEQGRTKERIIRFLTEASGEGELPVQILSMLEQWTSRSCRYAFVQAMLLRCDTAEMAEQAMSVPGLAPHLLARVGDRDFIVDPSAVSEIRQWLKNSGYPPRKGIGQALAAEPVVYPYISGPDADLHMVKQRTDRLSESGEWLYEPLSLRHYELEQANGAPSVTLLSDIDRIPAAWWRQLRSYHASTRKELMQQAVAMETAVQLKLEGQLRNFVPEQIEHRGDVWSVTGKLIGDEYNEYSIRSRLTPDMWEEMKLVLPSGVIL